MSDVSGTTASAGSAIITSLGIGSGLNVNSIISQLMAVQNQPVNLLQNQEAADQSTVSSFGQLQGVLATFQTTMQGLSTSSQYQSVSGSIANSSVASITTTSGASAANYALQVNQLAQAQSLVTAGQTSSSSAIGNGTISFNFGTINGTATNGQYGSGTTFTNSGAAAKTVTISSADNSLTGIAAAINAANIGVSASILNDGSSSPNRLSLSVTNPGAANSVQISVAGDPALANLLNEDPAGTQNLTQTSAAQSAQFTLNGIAITSSSNTDSSVISGATLKLLATNPVTPTTLTITKDNSGAVSAINAFVAAYNTVATTMQQATSYNSATKQAGVLQGQDSVLSIMSQMQSVLNNPVPGAPNAISMMAQVGVGYTSTGTLTVDSTKLQAALASNPSAVSGLFASNGTPTDSLVTFNSSTSATQPGAYAINVTQLAAQASTTGSAAAGTTITAGVNDSLLMNIDGISSNVTLAAGTYTASSLAAALQNAINSNAPFSNGKVSATVTQNSGVLSITSNSFGAASVATVSGGNGEATLLGSGTATVVAGVDVAGTINGQPATGVGQTLTGSSASNAAGLSININGGNLGSRGFLNYTQGYANELGNLMTTVLGKTGQIAAATAGLNATIKGFQASVTAMNSTNALIMANYQAEFSALDVTMGKLNSTSSFLTQQLAAIAK